MIFLLDATLKQIRLLVHPKSLILECAQNSESSDISILNFEKWFKTDKDKKIIPIKADFLLSKSS